MLCVCCVQIGARDRNVCMRCTVGMRTVCVCQGTEKIKWAGNESRVCVFLCYSVKSLEDHLQLHRDAGETEAQCFLVMY